MNEGILLRGCLVDLSATYQPSHGDWPLVAGSANITRSETSHPRTRCSRSLVILSCRPITPVRPQGDRMRITDGSAGVAFVAVLCSLLVPLAAMGEGDADEINLLSWGAGALVVLAPPSYSTSGSWSPNSLLDELPNTGWATPSGDLTPKVFVF